MTELTIKPVLLVREIFHFVSNAGENIALDAQGIRQWCLAHKTELGVVMIPVEQDVATIFYGDNAVEGARVAALTSSDRLEPVILGEFTEGDQTHFLIDGRHRYCRAARDGVSDIRAIILPEKLWRMFEVNTRRELTKEQLRAMSPGHLPRK